MPTPNAGSVTRYARPTGHFVSVRKLRLVIVVVLLAVLAREWYLGYLRATFLDNEFTFAGEFTPFDVASEGDVMKRLPRLGAAQLSFRCRLVPSRLVKRFSAGPCLTHVTLLALVPELQELELAHSTVEDLSPVANCRDLRQLDCKSTRIPHIRFLSDLRNLRMLDISCTDVESIAPIQTNSALVSLILSDTKISNLDSVGHCPGLLRLHISGCPITDLSPLRKCPQLSSLWADRTMIEDLSPLSELKHLSALHIDASHVRDLSPLASVSSLSILSMRGIPKCLITPLAKLSGLKELAIDVIGESEEQQMQTVLLVSQLESLQELAVSFTIPPSTHVLSRLAFIRKVAIFGVPPHPTDLVALQGVSDLDLSHTPLNDLSFLGQLTSLKRLTLNDRAFSESEESRIRERLAYLSIRFVDRNDPPTRGVER